MSLPQEDSIIPIALEPMSFDRVLPARERNADRRSRRTPVTTTTAPDRASPVTLLLGLLAAVALLALPLPLLLDGTVSVAPRAGLLALFVLPPVIFMAVVQSRYGQKTE